MGGGPLCEKLLRVYLPQLLLPKLGAGELEGPRPSLRVGFVVVSNNFETLCNGCNSCLARISWLTRLILRC